MLPSAAQGTSIESSTREKQVRIVLSAEWQTWLCSEVAEGLLKTFTF